jgi:hypothetical protein
MATKVNFLIDQGTSFATAINLNDDDGNPLDLSGYTVAGQMRKAYSSQNYVAFVANLELGILNLGLSANTTGDLTAGRYVYDVELTDTNSIVTRLLEGVITVTPQVTRVGNGA